MKIPLIYPKIPGPSNCPLKQCVAFEKLDGTNIHWTWGRKYGWLKFGTRRDQYSHSDGDLALFKQNHPGLEDVGMIPNQSEMIDHILYNSFSCQTAIVFGEFFGQHSFAGSHVEEKKSEVIFDIMIDGRFLPPADFIANFSQVNIPRVVYKGKYSGQLVEDIRCSKYKVDEGTVIKGLHKNEVYMCKVKTNTYIQRLKDNFSDSWEEYGE